MGRPRVPPRGARAADEGAAMRPVLRDRLVMPILLPLGILAVIAAVLFGFSRILLSLTPTAATVTAIVVASGVVITAAVAAGRKQVRLSTLGAMLGVTAGVAMLAGGVALAVVGGSEEEGGGGEKPVVTLAAANIAFEPTSLTVPAGEAFTLQFHNQDANTQHNVQIFDDPKFAGTPLFSGRAGHGRPADGLRGRPARGGRLLLPLRGPPDDDGRDAGGAERRRWWRDRSERSRRWRRRDGRGPEPRVRHRHDRARAGADDDHVREPGRGRAAQHRDLRGQLARRRAVQRGAGHGARDRGVRRSPRCRRASTTSSATSTRT